MAASMLGVVAAVVLGLAGSPVMAATTDADWLEQAIASYRTALDTSQRDLRLEGFRHAERLFSRVANGSARNPELYTNWGNAALQAEHLGTAVLAYRRALVLDPDHSRAVQNLDFARTLLPEWVPAPSTGGVLDTFFFWHRTLTRSDRALGAAFGFAVAALLVAGAIRFQRIWLRNVAIVPGLLWLVLLASVAIDRSATALDEAVITADEAVARAADSALAPSTLPAPLPEGVEVRILERRSPWLRIRLANGRDAWVAESALTLVEVEDAAPPLL